MNRQKLIAVVTFLGGLYFVLEFLLPEVVGGVKVGQYHEQISNGLIAMGSIAIGLGIINLLMVHGSRIVFLRKGAFVSSALLTGLVVMAGLTLADWNREERGKRIVRPLNVVAGYAEKLDREGRVPKEEELNLLRRSIEEEVASLTTDRDESVRVLEVNGRFDDVRVREARERWDAAKQGLLSTIGEGSAYRSKDVATKIRALTSLHSALSSFASEHSVLKRIYKVVYEGLFISLGSAMFALLGFFIAAAAFRAFRVRSLESGLMMAAAVAVMLGQIPFGQWVWEGFPALRQWLLEVPSAGAFRAIKFGAAVAGLAMAIRMWFSIESRSFSGEGSK